MVASHADTTELQAGIDSPAHWLRAQPRAAQWTHEERKGKLSLSNHSLRLRKANGVIDSNDVTRSKITELGTNVTAPVLMNTPRVLSVQHLAETEGASCCWTSYEGHFEAKHVRHHSPIKQGEPLLALPAVLDNERSD